MINKVYLLTVTMTLLMPFNSDSRELGEIYDAVFSPDGKYIGLGTSSGFYMYDTTAEDFVNFISTEGGVHYILWSPDGKKVVLNHWDETHGSKSPPVYTVYDLESNKMILKNLEQVKWFEKLAYEFYPEFPPLIREDIYPSLSCTLTGSIRFSLDSEKISFLTMNDDIIEYDLHTFEKKVIYKGADQYLISFDYIDSETRKLWIGTLNDLIIVQNPGEVNVNIEKIYYGVGMPYALSKDGKYLISATGIFPAPIGIGYSTFYHELRLLESGEKLTIADGGVLASYYPHRSIFVPGKNIVKVLVSRGVTDEDVKCWNTREFNIETMEMTKEISSGVTSAWDGFLYHPFSPDGEQFLFLYHNNLYLYDFDTWDKEQLLPKPSAVDEFERIHENG